MNLPTNYRNNMAQAGLVLATCAPLLNYFGHGVEIVSAVLGILMLAAARTWQQAAPLKSAFTKDTKLSLALIAIMLLCFTYSCVAGINPVGTLDSYAGVLIVLIGLTAFGYLITGTNSEAHIKAFKAVAILTCLLGLMVIIERFVPSISGMLHGVKSYARLNFAGPVLLWGLPFITWMMIKDRRFIPAFLFVVLAIAATNGRSGWVMVPILLAGFGLFFYKKMDASRWAALLIGAPLAFVAGLATLGMSEGAKHVQERTMDLATGSGTGRIDIWEFAVAYWWENARLWGIGVQGFRYIDFSAVQLNSHYHPHNSIIQLLIETGIIGLITASAALAAVCRQAWKRLSSVPETRAVLALCFIGLAGCSLFNTSLFHAWWVLFMFIPLAWALGWPVKK